MRTVLVLLSLVVGIALAGTRGDGQVADKPNELRAGFAEADITPKLGDQPVYLAGFGHNRKATAVRDPLKARAAVLQQGDKKIALVSVDLVGLFHANVLNLRKELKDFHYVLVSSTHNHEGPDTLGLWGPNAFKSGVDRDYLKQVETRIVESVRSAEKVLQPVVVTIGSTKAPELLNDNREPYVKHDELVALQFKHSKTGKPVGILVQWNCHPETLGSKNTELSADFVGYTVHYLRKRHDCPVAYFTGTVGGLMTSLGVEVKDDQGKQLDDGTFEKTERYGLLVGKLADRALESAKPLRLTPLEVRSQDIFISMENKLYHAARWLKVLERDAYVWTGDPYKAEPAAPEVKNKQLAVRTEVAILRLGELEIVAVPGEIYPELVLDKIQDPADPNADFPDAPIEPALYKQLRQPHRMIIGLANDEIGYILPKRQWDERPPFCYGRKKAQYGEENSVGPEAGPIICRAIRDLAEQNRP
ncbi:MAG: neutral/alkaline non-lysosomal ceramidase N-terminal domain-containing protein [Acidobacteria bacterium]|nr:neutral/alkaline non-lysosomal ceramidase N-terminal domain-containing protein [Acidobacteriota bacterium]